MATVGPSVADDSSTDTATNDTAAGGSGRIQGAMDAISLLRYRIVSLAPPLVLHGALYALPPWATPLDAVFLLVTGVASIVWAVVELGHRIVPRIRSH